MNPGTIGAAEQRIEAVNRAEDEVLWLVHHRCLFVHLEIFFPTELVLPLRAEIVL